MNIENVITRIDKLKQDSRDSSTGHLLRKIKHYRLDWGYDVEDKFSEEYNIGATKAILLEGLANQNQLNNARKFSLRDQQTELSVINHFVNSDGLTIETIQDIFFTFQNE